MKRFVWIIAVILILFIKIIHDTSAVKVNEVMIENDKLEANQRITILQISDVHNRNLDGKFDKIISLDPDLIVLTGDLIDRTSTDLTYTEVLLEKLITMNTSIYFVAGNHEHESPIYSELRELLTVYDVTRLENEQVTLEINGVELNLVGIGNHSTGHADLLRAFRDIDTDLLTILLSHSPILLDNQVDLTLSGHTHGGQVRLPLIGAIVAPEQGLFPKYDKGLYEPDSGGKLYIDSGLGTTFLPIRFLNEAQVSYITIEGSGLGF